MNDENNYIGNISTLGKTIVMMFAGWCIGYFASKGLNLPIDAETLAETIFTVLCFLGAYIDAKYPNTFKFLHNNKECDCAVLETEEDLINEEYISNDDDGC